MAITEEKTSSPSSSTHNSSERRNSKSSNIQNTGDGDDSKGDDSSSNEQRSQSNENNSSTWDQLKTWIPLTETASTIWNQFTETSETDNADDDSSSSGTTSSSSRPLSKKSPLRSFGMAGEYTPQPSSPPKEDQLADENSKSERRNGDTSGRNDEIELVAGKSDDEIEMMAASSGDTSPSKKSAQRTENNSRYYPKGPVLKVISLVLFVVGVVVYFVTRSSDESSSTAHVPATSSSSPSTFPSASPSSTFSPSSSPTLPFIFDPPLPNDCNRVQNGETVQGQELWIERNFDVVVDVAMGGIVGLTETMKQLESEMQQTVIPMLVGCGSSRKLRQDRMLVGRNINRYIVGNGKIHFRPSSLEVNADCSSRICLSGTFSLDLFLKTEKEQFFVVVDLFEELFAGDLVDLLRLERPLFVSVAARSMVYNDPTKAPSTAPSLVPSLAPSNEPTQVRSQTPSASPTRRPTFRPTPGPTLAPSVSPSASPSDSPTLNPTTSQPTIAPSISPSDSPSQKPSNRPSSVPTRNPSRTPTQEPSIAPTPAPTTSPPTVAPSISPSDSPSQKPSNRPSSVPTRSPSRTPTREPSIAPTPLPTLTPSVAPTQSPTTSPPTRAPSKKPTRSPTRRPSPMPTRAPTTTPSSSPTGLEDRNGYFRQLDRPLVVACAGDSLTRGRDGGNPSFLTYPKQLQGMLGATNFRVLNFGRNAVTAMRGMLLSYVDKEEFQSSLDAQPDIYLLMLGTNDSRYWVTDAHRFPEGLEWIVNKVRSIQKNVVSRPRIILAIPPWVKTENFGVVSTIVANNVRAEIQTLARRENLQVVNMHDVTVNQNDIFSSDGVHLNGDGYRILAAAWKVAIQCNSNGICEAGENCETCSSDCYLNCPSRVQ